MTIEEYKAEFINLFKEMQEEFQSNIKFTSIWHNKTWTDSEGKEYPEKYTVSIEFED